MLISDTSFHKNNGDEELYVAIRSSETDQRSLSSNLIICKQGDESTGTCFIQKIYAPSSSLLQGKHLPVSPSPLRLNIFRLFVILSLTQ